ncbi:MAG: FAD-binding protein [Gammaproteobacteria bacterium]|nr:FAD-binding protein [Gammaproteobacteria bacterium]MDH5592221.1 FAD-binding protein [Gammaproteobacteria bacterium]
MNIEQIQQQVIDADQLQIVGNKSHLKFTSSPTLEMSLYSGLIGYHPEELVMTAKSGTRIKDIESILGHKGQTLPFVVHDHENATIGGAYALGSPELRDAVLGVKIIDGQGRLLNFGGQVMKNVAGYDVARLLVGSKGKLAVICEISFRVLPKAYAIHSTSSAELITPTPSAIRDYIEHGLKNVFDPNGVFV